MLGSVRRITRTVSHTFTVLSSWTRGSAPRHRDSLTSQTPTELGFTTPIARSQEEMLMWQTILPREDNLRNEEYLGQVEEALRRAGIQYGQTSSMNPPPSPSFSIESRLSNHMSGPLNYEISNMQQTVNGQSNLVCTFPNGQCSIMYPSPLGNGQTPTYSQ